MFYCFTIYSQITLIYADDLLVYHVLNIINLFSNIFYMLTIYSQISAIYTQMFCFMILQCILMYHYQCIHILIVYHALSYDDKFMTFSRQK